MTPYDRVIRARQIRAEHPELAEAMDDEVLRRVATSDDKRYCDCTPCTQKGEPE